MQNPVSFPSITVDVCEYNHRTYALTLFAYFKFARKYTCHANLLTHPKHVIKYAKSSDFDQMFNNKTTVYLSLVGICPGTYPEHTNGCNFTSGYPWSIPIRLNIFSYELSLIGTFLSWAPRDNCIGPG
jgi:hypothetical protein